MAIWSGFCSNFKPKFIKNKFYVYAISLVEYGTPIYIGKGCGSRVKHHKNKNSKTPISKVMNKYEDYWVSILVDSNNEDVIFQLEKYYIGRFGKKMDGGVLLNVEDGGKGGGTLYKRKEVRMDRSLEYSKKFGKSCHLAGFIFPSKRVAFKAMGKDRQSTSYYKELGYYFEISEDWKSLEQEYFEKLELSSKEYQEKITLTTNSSSHRKKSIVFKSKKYESITQAALENGKTPAAIFWWLKNPSHEDCFYLED